MHSPAGPEPQRLDFLLLVCSRVMRNSVRDCDALLARRSSRCVLPVWE